MNNNIDIFKIRDVKTPKRNEFDAGTDFFVPAFNYEFIHDLMSKNIKNELIFGEDNNGKYVELKPNHQILIPSGIKARIQDTLTYWDAENKSGIATKKSLVVGAQVVDATYSGEIHLNVHNVGHNTERIYGGDKLVQFVQKEYRNTQIIVHDNKEEFENLEWPGDRGSKGFGNGTGNN